MNASHNREILLVVSLCLLITYAGCSGGKKCCAVTGASKCCSAQWSQLLADDLSNATLPAESWTYEEGVLELVGKGSIWTQETYGNFVLDFEFKVAKGTNSGVFIRTGDIRKSVQTGIEIQILDSFGKEQVGKHDCGAVYDCLAPSKNTTKEAGQWNSMTIKANGADLDVMMNGEQIIDMNLDEWTEPRKNPDGSKNKFKNALKDFPRVGHIGFQDHGKKVWYRNIRIKSL